MGDGMNQARAAVYAAIADAMGESVEALDDGTHLVGDLGAKSVNFVRIIGELEDGLDLEIPYMEFRRNGTIAEVIAYVGRLLES